MERRVAKLDGVEYESLILRGRDSELWADTRRSFFGRVTGWFRAAMRGRSIDDEAETLIGSAFDSIKALMQRPVLTNDELAARIAEIRSREKLNKLAAEREESDRSAVEARQVIRRVSEVLDSKRYLQALIKAGAIQIALHDGSLVLLIMVEDDADTSE